MVEAHGRDVHVVPFSMPIFRHEFDDVDVANSNATHDLHVHPNNGTYRTQATQEIERALVWVLCAENYYHKPKDEFAFGTFENVLPVTQEVLKIMEDIVEELKLIEDLDSSLNEIFLGEDLLVRMISTALRHNWDTQAEDKQKHHRFIENPPGYVDIWDKLQDNDTFKALRENYHPIPTLRTRSDADLAQSTTPVAILARVIIAVSSIQKWPQEKWSVEMHRSITSPADPMDELLGGYALDEAFADLDIETPTIYFE